MTPITAADLAMTPEKARAYFDALDVVRNVLDAYTLGEHRTDESYADRDRLLLSFYNGTDAMSKWLISAMMGEAAIWDEADA